MGEAPKEHEDTTPEPEGEPHIIVRDLTMAFGDFVLMHDLNFTVRHGDVFVIMGGSGCGKSTLLNHLIGLLEPAKGEIFYRKFNFTQATNEERQRMLRRMGVLYQGGHCRLDDAGGGIGLLWGVHRLSPQEIQRDLSSSSRWSGCAGSSYYPSQISGGMQKRAGLARGRSIDVLFFDGPSRAGHKLAATRRPDFGAARWKRDRRGRHPRVAEHLCDRQQQCLSRRETRTMIASGNLENCWLIRQDPKVHKFWPAAQRSIE